MDADESGACALGVETVRRSGVLVDEQTTLLYPRPSALIRVQIALAFFVSPESQARSRLAEQVRQQHLVSRPLQAAAQLAADDDRLQFLERSGEVVVDQQIVEFIRV